MPNHEAFTPWPNHVWHGPILWLDDEEGIPPVETTFNQEELLSYCQEIDSNLETWLNSLDLNAPSSGFPWYRISKLEHLLVNLRHVGVHVGQMQELLYARNLEPKWIGSCQ